MNDAGICRTSLVVTQKTSPIVSIFSDNISSDRLIHSISSLSGSTQLVEYPEPSVVHLGAEENVDGLFETHRSEPICSSPKQMSPIITAGSSENVGAAEKADRSSVPSRELAMDFSQEEQCPEETEHHDVRSVVQEEDLITETDSTLVFSGQDGPASSKVKSISFIDTNH